MLGCASLAASDLTPVDAPHTSRMTYRGATAQGASQASRRLCSRQREKRTPPTRMIAVNAHRANTVRDHVPCHRLAHARLALNALAGR